MSKILLQNII